MTTRRIIILGSTGSIGTQAIEVITHINALAAQGSSSIRLEVVGLAAGGNLELLIEQARRLGVRAIAIAHGAAPASADLPPGCRVMRGAASAEELVRSVDCDMVVAAIVGVAGLPATLAAVECRRDVALANKETLVAAGALVGDARLLPIDSEHAGLWQCLQSEQAQSRSDASGAGSLTLGWCRGVRRATITASGGPFREWSLRELEHATPEQALRHPTWRMGRKVTIDSATLMNKALELIEAHWLFGLPASRLGAVVHPQSLVHAIVEFQDGSCVAQLAAPDMRTPIQRALAWPHCLEGCSRRIDWTELRSLTFEPVDDARFPAVSLATRALERGGTSGAILNAANEAAVNAFLSNRIGFLEITRIVEEALSELPVRPVRAIQDVLDADAIAREFVRRRVEGRRR